MVRFLNLPYLPNRHGKYKRINLLAILTLLSLPQSALSQGIQAKIGEKVPIHTTEPLILQVSPDPGFGKLMLEQQVTEVPTTIDLPSSGIYHWRFIRPTNPVDDDTKAEGNTFVSGSLVAIHPSTFKDGPVSIEWDAEPSANKYRLYVTSSVRSLLVSEQPFYMVSKFAEPVIIEIAPYRDNTPIYESFQFDPSLSITLPVAKVKPKPPQKPKKKRKKSRKKPRKPKKPPTPKIPEKEDVEPEEPINIPIQRLSLGLGMVSENLTLQKLDTRLESKGQSAFYEAAVDAQPNPGLAIGLNIGSWVHKSTVDLGTTDETLEIAQTHILAFISVGGDFAKLGENPEYELILAPAFGFTQMPRLPLEVIAGEIPRPQKHVAALYGMRLEYIRWLYRGYIRLAGVGFTSETKEVQLWRAWAGAGWAAGDESHIGLRYFQENGELKMCHKDEEICLDQGKANSNYSVSGVTLHWTRAWIQ